MRPGKLWSWSLDKVADFAVFLLRRRLLLHLAMWFMRRLFARLSFTPYVAGRTPADTQRFVGDLAREVRKKFAARELSPSFLRAWVRALSEQALLGPGRRRRAARAGLVAPAFAILSPSSACNLRCAHCYAAGDPSLHQQLPFAAVDAVVSELEREGTNLVIISGGEPLLWRDHHDDLFQLVERHPLLLFVVYTNATLLGPELARRFARAGNLIPLISVEGSSERTDVIRGRGTFFKVESAMRSLCEVGVLFGVSVTASRLNQDAVGSPEFLKEMVDERGASFIWVLELAALGRASSDWSLDEQARSGLQRRLESERERGRLIVSFLETVGAKTGCFGARRFDGFFYLDWEGFVRRCVYQPQIHADASLLLRRDKDAAGLEHGARRVLREANQLPPCPLKEHC